MNISEMDINDIEERRAQIAEEMTADGANIDALLTEARALLDRKTQLASEEEERRKLAESVAAGKTGKTIEEHKEEHKMDIKEIRSSNEYIEAYAKYVKTGKDAECRALLSDNATNGVVPVPTFVAEIVAERLKESKILSRVRRMNAAGNVKVGFEIDAPAAGVHEEGGDPITAEALVLGIVELRPVTLKKYVPISDEALDSMSGEEYLRYIYEEITRGIIKARENAVVAAILAAPQTATTSAPAVAKTGTAAGAIDDFVKARALLSSAAEDLVIICTPAQYATYRGLQMAATYGVDPFDGLEVLFSDAATAPIIGDLYGVMENLPKGDNVQFKYDDLTNMKDDIVNVLGRLPVATGVVGNKYFAKVSA